jgi:hypothetical protein
VKCQSKKTKKVQRQFTCVVLAIAAINAGCVKQQPREVYEALASLRKVQAATQVGVSYMQYGQLLIESKDKTNAALRVLSDGPVKSEIQATMDAYADAGQVWGAKIKSVTLTTVQEPGRTIIARYKLKTTLDELDDADKSLQLIWLVADTHLMKLAELLPENRK